MNFLKNIDGRSLFIGLLLMGLFFLAAALGDSKKKMEALEQEMVEVETETPYPTLFQQEEMASRTLEKRAQKMLNGVIGKERALVKVRAVMNPEGEIRQLSMAVAIDKTKIVLDPEGLFVEEDRRLEEIQQLTDLVSRAIGIDESRGDQVTVFAQHFDQTQHIQQREMAVADERKHFWTNIAKILFIVVALLVLRWAFRRSKSSADDHFLAQPTTQTALFLAGGIFLCLCALGFGGSRLSLAEASALPGLFLLIVGIQRVWPAKHIAETSEGNEHG